MSVQRPPQRTSPAPQPQVPASHTSPSAHAEPHSPQLDGSVSRSTHSSPQGVRPGAHSHRPLTHVAPLTHAVPHAPQ